MIYLPIYNGPGGIPDEIKPYLEDPSTEWLMMFSGGKDSIAQVLYLLELGVPKERITLHHHDVDGGGENLWDWPCTPSYCRAFAEAMGLKILFSHAEGGITREIYRENEGKQDVLFQATQGGSYQRLKANKGNTTKRKFPAVSASLTTRWCSAVAKIDVMGRVLTNHPDYSSGRFLVCTGERREESPKRSEYDYCVQHKATTRKRDVMQWRPVLDWSESQVWDIIRRHGIQPHPCYMLGWSRCSCQTCIFGSDNTWASIADISPDKILEIGIMEEELEHTLYNGITILDKAARGTSFIPASMKARWKAEALSEFKSPILIGSDWTLPAGASSSEITGAI